jgi:glycosyltransferase involved in cell wall biosynthesis
MKTTESVSVVSFTHIGYYKDLKSEETYYSVRSLADFGMIRNIFVIDIEETYDISIDLFKTPIPGGKTIPRALYLTESLVPQFNARDKIIKLFDHLTSKKIENPRIIHSFPQLTKSIAAAKESGSTAAVYASSSHTKHVRSLLMEERDRLDINSAAEVGERALQGFELADYILYLSEYSKDTFIENGFEEGKLLKVGPLGTDINHYTPTTPPEDEFVAVSVANMTELKGIQYLIDAWEKSSIPNARLILCGTMNKAVKTTLKPRIERMESVDHVGYVDDPHKYFSKASVLVHPSLSESFGKVITEGMASALPVIITEHAPRELVDDAGFVVPIRDSDAIADRLQYIYEHPEEAKEMGRRGRRITEQNTWDDFSTRVMEAHKEILRREDHV